MRRSASQMPATTATEPSMTANAGNGHMLAALAEAEAAAARGEVPVGAVVVAGGQVIAKAGNRTRELADPTAHAEMLAIRAACAAVGSERLADARSEEGRV